MLYISGAGDVIHTERFTAAFFHAHETFFYSWGLKQLPYLLLVVHGSHPVVKDYEIRKQKCEFTIKKFLKVKYRKFYSILSEVTKKDISSIQHHFFFIQKLFLAHLTISLGIYNMRRHCFPNGD